MTIAGSVGIPTLDLRERQVPILQVTGYSGAGKTTMMEATLKKLKGKRRIVYVLNDGQAPDSGVVDSKRLAGLADLRTFADECFGCRTPEELINVTSSQLLADDEPCILIIEGLGFVEGFEVPTLLRKHLNVCVGVYTLVRVSTYDLFHIAPTFPSQVQVANLGIGFTNASVGNGELDQVQEAIARLNSSVPFEVIERGNPAPAHVMSWLLGDGEVNQETIVCDAHACDHEHHHDHHDHCEKAGHSHVHSHHRFMFNRAIAPGTRPDQLMNALSALPGIERAKFNLGAFHYSKVGNDPWGDPQDVPDDGDNSLTLYSERPFDAQLLGELVVTPVAPTSESRTADTKQAMRQSSMAPDDMERLLRYSLDQLPTEPVIFDSRFPIIFPEVVTFSGELLRNPVSEQVNPELVTSVLNRRVEYFVACAEIALPGSKSWNDPDFGMGKYYCAIAPAWFMTSNGDRLDSDLKERISRLPLEEFFGEGMLAIDKFSADDAAARILLTEIRIAAEFTGTGHTTVQQGLAHLQNVAEGDGRSFLLEAINEL